jgi:hypothetical protein
MMGVTLAHGAMRGAGRLLLLLLLLLLLVVVLMVCSQLCRPVVPIIGLHILQHNSSRASRSM